MQRRQFMTSAAAILMAAMVPIPLRAQTALKAKGYLRTNWSKDPFAYGSYSYVAKGARQRDRRRLAAPIDDVIFFAGEACHPDYNSTVHAAYESGLMAAKKVLKTDAQTVAVVGAGISGLAAAHRLAGADRTVTVFEARDRIGGRIWTNDALGVPLDLGASWIHGTDGNPLTTLSDQLNIERVPTDDSYVIRGSGGRLLKDIPGWMEEVVSIQHEAGTELHNLNKLAYMLQSDYDGDEVVFPDGYAQVFEGLRGDYEVLMGKTVSAIHKTADGVSLAVKGQQAEFDAVVVTLPLGVLKKGAVQFSPPLPKKKQTAIDRLGMGVLDKVYLQFDDVFWDKGTTWIELPETGLPHGQFNQWLNIYKYTDAPILMAFNGATPARELAEIGDQDLVSLALSALQRAYPQ